MPSNFYRSDGWVKTTLGPAVPGAQVYVLTQPANVTPPITPPRTLPVPFTPNPQVQVYSDAGFTPLAQPVITDGFGHYDFYTLPGLYTVAIFFGGKLQQFYIDQSIGSVGSAGGTTLLLEVNGSPLFNQTVFNLQQGAGVILTPDNFGNVTITSNGVGISLATNGTPNGSQTLLNLVNGVNISITQDGAGNVTVNDVAPSTTPTPDNASFVLWQADPTTFPNAFNHLYILENPSASAVGSPIFTTIPADTLAGASTAVTVDITHGITQAFWGKQFAVPTRRTVCTGTVKFNANNISADAVYKVGFSNNGAFGTVDPTTIDSCCIGLHKVSGVAQGNWQLFTSVGGSVTTVDSGIPVVYSTRYKFKIVMNSGVVTLFINGVAVAVSSTNLPTANCGLIWWLHDNNGGGGSAEAGWFEYNYLENATP
jgi:hypothetical protein